ncbi:MAG: hypothetical protein OQK29_04920 [Ignavibacteriaceae bacterium]|nr:hypothetical protein [Ignavibacteriaceae bacterium]
MDDYHPLSGRFARFLPDFDEASIVLGAKCWFRVSRNDTSASHSAGSAQDDKASDCYSR